jgi:hypothetical protein
MTPTALSSSRWGRLMLNTVTWKWDHFTVLTCTEPMVTYGPMIHTSSNAMIHDYSIRPNHFDIVTYERFAWLIITGSRLQSIITAHNRWLSKTRSISSWTTSVFFSTVTHLLVIWESLTSSAYCLKKIGSKIASSSDECQNSAATCSKKTVLKLL